MQKHIILGTSLTLLAALITGCNSNDDDNAALTQVPSTTQVTITPSLGKILNAKVVLKNAKTGAMLGEGKTDETTGIAKFAAQKTTDPVVVEVQGTAGATYFDESKKNSASFDVGQAIKAVVPTLTSNANIGVSTLTDIAYKAALKKAGDNEKSITAAIATASNDAIRTALAPELSSITIAPALVGSADDLTKLTNTPEGKYELRLAALAQLVPDTDTTPALTALQKLAEDFADGNFDGMANGAAVGLYTQANLQNKIQTNLNSTITAANLSGFNVNAFTLGFGNIVITVEGTGGGTGSGQNCALNANYNVQGIPLSYIVCYTNFPQNAVCGAGNQAFSGANIPGFNGTFTWTYSQVATCPAGSIQVDYVN